MPDRLCAPLKGTFAFRESALAESPSPEPSPCKRSASGEREQKDPHTPLNLAPMGATLVVAPLSGARRRSIASAETSTNGGFTRCSAGCAVPLGARGRQRGHRNGKGTETKEERADEMSVELASGWHPTWHWGLRASSPTICGEVTATTISRVERETWAEVGGR